MVVTHRYRILGLAGSRTLLGVAMDLTDGRVHIDEHELARGNGSVAVPSVHLHGVTHADTSALSVLIDVDLDVAAAPHPPGWVGVVGENGAGKSTLLRLLAGELSPTSGTIDVQSTVPPRLVPQSCEGLTTEVLGFAWTWDGVSERLRRRLDLDPDDLDPATGRGWEALSAGQRQRWQLAAALAEEPEVLLLDEPTNHLDGRARELVLGVLAGFKRVEVHAGDDGAASERWRAAEAAERAAQAAVASEVTAGLRGWW